MGRGAKFEHWFSIDPGTNSMGVALFKGDHLIRTWCLKATHTRREARYRIDELLTALLAIFKDPIFPPSFVVCEAPLLQGKANNIMQRFLGAIEKVIPLNIPIHYLHPMTIKKRLGSGKLSKPEMAMISAATLKTKREKAFVNQLSKRGRWDETDAIAVGLAYLKGDDGPAPL